MRDILRQIEAHLKNIFEHQPIKLLGGGDVEGSLATRFAEAMDAEVRRDDRGQLVAAHFFVLQVPARFASDIRSNDSLLDGLAESIMEAGEKAGLAFSAPVTIHIFPSEELAEGQFAVQAMWTAPKLAETAKMTRKPVNPNIPPKAFLIVSGSKIFSLEQESVQIGRKLDNQLVIDDPRVSRQHALIRAAKGTFMIFDLESSGGTYVNSERVTQTTLHPGDVISLAGVPLVYGQDAVRAIDQTQEYNSPTKKSGDMTTVSVKLEELDLDTFDE